MNQQFFYASVQISAHARPTNSDVVLTFLWKKKKKKRCAEMAEMDAFFFLLLLLTARQKKNL